LGGGIIATNSSGIYVKPSAMTTYVVEQTLCGQITTDTVNVYLTNGISEHYKNPIIKVFPNPAKDEVIISTKQDNTHWRVQLSDLNGKMVEIKSQKIDSHQLKLSTENLQQGMYLLHVNNEIIKLMIQHE